VTFSLGELAGILEAVAVFLAYRAAVRLLR
jgi:hypothetical protein